MAGRWTRRRSCSSGRDPRGCLGVARHMRPAPIMQVIQLRGMDGIAALCWPGADPTPYDIPVIAVTASVMTQDRKQILAAGFDAYQPKPITVKAFLDAVRETLDRSRGTMS